jgi:drug/metabolite transporter (DMT)-like permease
MTAPIRERDRLGLPSAVVAVLVWGASSALIKGIDGLGGLSIAVYRIWFGAVLVTIVFRASGGRITLDLLRRSIPSGLTFTADLILFFSAVQITSVANATVIGALQPVLVLAVAGPLFGERARAAELGWGAIAVAGTAIVVLGGDAGGANSLNGDLLAIGALVAWTAYFVATKAVRQVLSPFEFLTGMTIVSAIVTLPIPLLVDDVLEGTTAGGWASIACITVVNGLLGHFLMARAHGQVSLLTISLLTLAIPVISAAVAAVWLDEPLTWLQIGGMAVVLSALALVSASAARREEVVEVEVEALGGSPHP